MSSLHRGDDDLHYCDNSHRWIAPSDIDQEVWEAELATHLEKHRIAMGDPAAQGRGKCRTRGFTAPTMPARIIPARKPAGKPAGMPATRAGQASEPTRRPKAPAREPIGRQPGVPAGQR